MSAAPIAACTRARLPHPGAWVLGVVAILTAPLEVVAAAPSPDAAEYHALAADLERASAVRVTGTFGVRVLSDLRVDATGISSARWGPGGRTRPALIVSRDAMPPATPEPIAWSAISRIETGRTSVGRYGVRGAVLGGLLGGLVWRFIPTAPDGGQGSLAVIAGTPAMVGLVLGALLGSQQYTWRTVYSDGLALGRAASSP